MEGEREKDMSFRNLQGPKVHQLVTSGLSCKLAGQDLVVSRSALLLSNKRNRKIKREEGNENVQEDQIPTRYKLSLGLAKPSSGQCQGKVQALTLGAHLSNEERKKRK